jgi:D-amino-acid oxidase
MPVYLDYLTTRLTDADGRLAQGAVTSLESAMRKAPIVVNCSGLGARHLARDTALVPVRGQLVVVENPGIDTFFGEHTHDAAEPTYFLPHGGHVVLGGTAEHGRADTRTDAEAAAAIVRRCAAVEPSLGRARVISHRVGIRPSRPSVRVEHVRVQGRSIMHNYGHGGSGFSLAWGCAREVVRMVQATL